MSNETMLTTPDMLHKGMQVREDIAILLIDRRQEAKQAYIANARVWSEQLTAGVRLCMYCRASAISESHCTACSVLYKLLLGFTICSMHRTTDCQSVWKR